MAKRYKYFPWFFMFISISLILLHIIQNKHAWIIQENFENMKTLPIDYYVITMGQPHRIENIQKQTDKLNSMNSGADMVKIEKVDAVNGDDLNIEQLVNEGKVTKEILENKFDLNFYGDFNKRKYIVGCYLSHIRFYEKILSKINNGEIDSNGYSIIFEDDFEVKDDFFTGLKNGINYLEQNNTDFDMLFLGLHSEENDLIGSNVYRPNCKKDLYQCYYTHAYLIPNNKVTKLLDKMKFIDSAVDVKMMKLFVNGEILVYRIMPDIAIQNSPITGSTIQ